LIRPDDGSKKVQALDMRLGTVSGFGDEMPAPGAIPVASRTQRAPAGHLAPNLWSLRFSKGARN